MMISSLLSLGYFHVSDYFTKAQIQIININNEEVFNIYLYVDDLFKVVENNKLLDMSTMI